MRGDRTFQRIIFRWGMAIALMLVGGAIAPPAWGELATQKAVTVDGKLAFEFNFPRSDWLIPGAIPPDSPIITSYNISQQGMTVPSLWWVQEQFGGKLLELWLAYPKVNNSPAWVDLVVNDQIWSLLNYLERYTFLNHFGTAAQEYGYSVRVFNPNRRLLATYFCTFPPSGGAPAPGDCTVTIGSGRTSGIRGNPTSPLSP